MERANRLSAKVYLNTLPELFCDRNHGDVREQMDLQASLLTLEEVPDQNGRNNCQHDHKPVTGEELPDLWQHGYARLSVRRDRGSSSRYRTCPGNRWGSLTNLRFIGAPPRRRWTPSQELGGASTEKPLLGRAMRRGGLRSTAKRLRQLRNGAGNRFFNASMSLSVAEALLQTS